MLHPFFGFWKALPKPIIALSPMDGVTDFACRFMMARHGRPDVLFTEFTTAEGLFYAPERILKDFEYHEIERPIVAQIYGHRPEDFYRATHVVCELGFDGVDINMGCPAKQVVKKNCGAKLITVPDLALEIIRATRAAIHDWANGQTLEDLKLPERVLATVSRMNLRRSGMEKAPLRRLIPYSVKTRIGYEDVVIDRWTETLLREQPAVISIHGRTLKQMYKGSAQWSAIGQAAAIARGSGTLILGNGDISDLEQAHRLARETGVDGVLIGRSAIGNPWIFQHPGVLPSVSNQPRSGVEGEAPAAWPMEGATRAPIIDRKKRIDAALEHAEYLESLAGEREFNSIRKHLCGYLKHFPDAATVRMNALRARNSRELRVVLKENGLEFPGPDLRSRIYL
jgi:tRNA-dihydrouridine synthase